MRLNYNLLSEQLIAFIQVLATFYYSLIRMTTSCSYLSYVLVISLKSNYVAFFFRETIIFRSLVEEVNGTRNAFCISNAIRIQEETLSSAILSLVDYRNTISVLEIKNKTILTFDALRGSLCELENFNSCVRG